jgi:aminocarboxymuconate-semialdehyde decarboxylase
MRIIDFHNHFYPPEYIGSLQQDPGNVAVTIDADGNPVLHSPGDSNIAVPGHRDIGARTRALDEAGVAMQVVTFTSPGTHIEKPERAVTLAATVNDILAGIRESRPDRYTALATLPLNDPQGSVREFDRAVNQLGFKGVMLFSNVNGKALADEEFWPLYEAANDVGAVMYVHPTHPVGVEAMTDYWLMPLVGFLMDTTLAAGKLVFSGVAERFPDIRWVLAHLGGAVPYLAERFDRGYFAFSDCRKHINRPPSEYFKEFYYDTVNFDTNALKFALQFAGADRVMAGSDYPHQIGSLEKMVSSLSSLDVSDEDREKICWRNASQLLGV